MRKVILVGLIAAMVVAVAAMAAEMPAKVTIKECATTKGAVEFDHKLHVARAKACVDCHHTMKDLTAENVGTMAVESCGKCHIKPEKATTPTCGGKTPKDNAYHLGCIPCHKEAKAAKADSKAPTMCTGCHAKTGA
jgi:hypothetical protein